MKTRRRWKIKYKPRALEDSPCSPRGEKRDQGEKYATLTESNPTPPQEPEKREADLMFRGREQVSDVHSNR